MIGFRKFEGGAHVNCERLPRFRDEIIGFLRLQSASPGSRWCSNQQPLGSADCASCLSRKAQSDYALIFQRRYLRLYFGYCSFIDRFQFFAEFFFSLLVDLSCGLLAQQENFFPYSIPSSAFLSRLWSLQATWQISRASYFARGGVRSLRSDRRSVLRLQVALKGRCNNEKRWYSDFSIPYSTEHTQQDLIKCFSFPLPNKSN